MKLIFAITLTIILGTTSIVAQGKGKGKGKGKGRSSGEEEVQSHGKGEVGFTTSITAIDGNRITYLKPSENASMSRGKGKGKSKGRFHGTASGPTETKVLSEKALITTATTTRRTGDLIVGIELGGGIRNKVFEQIDERGVAVRLVVKDDRIVEINVLTSEDDSEAPIAVKPKRPPMKK